MKLTEEQIRNYQLTDEDVRNMESFKLAMNGEKVPNMVKLQDFLATPSAQILIPRVTLGAMREVSEPMWIAVNFLQKVRLQSGTTMVFPSIGTIPRAYDVAEAQEIGMTGVSLVA